MDVMKIRPLITLAVLAAAVPCTVLAAPAPAPGPVRTMAPRPGAASLANEDTVEGRLTRALHAIPAQQRNALRARMRLTAPSGEQPVSGQLRPNTFRTMRATMVRPRDTVTSDASIPLRYVRKLDVLCRTMPADARRGAGMSDDACAKLRTRAAAAPG